MAVKTLHQAADGKSFLEVANATYESIRPNQPEILRVVMGRLPPRTAVSR